MKVKKTVSDSESSDSLPTRRKPKKAANAALSTCSSPERDTDKSVRMPLIFSPKKTPGTSQIMPKGSPKKQPVNEGKSVKVRANRKTDLIQRHNARDLRPREHEITSEDELQTHVNAEKENKSAPSGVEEGQNLEKRRNNGKALTESECEIVEQTALTILSPPPKRVLRSTVESKPVVESGDSQVDRQAKKSQRRTASRSKIIKTSDSESKLSSCGDRSDNTGDSGKVSKATNKRRNLAKRFVHKRVNELTKETSSQSSEEDSDGTSNRQLKKGQVHPKSAKAAQKNAEDQITSENDMGVETVSYKKKVKAGSDSERASSKSQALKVFKQTANKNSKKRKDEMSDEAPWTDEEINKLNEYVL